MCVSISGHRSAPKWARDRFPPHCGSLLISVCCSQAISPVEYVPTAEPFCVQTSFSLAGPSTNPGQFSVFSVSTGYFPTFQTRLILDCFMSFLFIKYVHLADNVEKVQKYRGKTKITCNPNPQDRNPSGHCSLYHLLPHLGYLSRLLLS